MVLVRSNEGKAVVRFGEGPLEMITVGDRLGHNRAEVKEIIPGRMILDEIFTGKDGNPNRAEIILKDGERGGTRILLRSDDVLPPDPLRRAIFPEREIEGD